MARDTEHITMLQRSPSYVLALPGRDPVADLMRKVLPKKAAYAAIRWKNIMVSSAFYRLSRRRPQLVRRWIRAGTVKALPDGYDVDTHFRPRYNPWDQRVCPVPDADLFRAIRSGRVSVVTDTIETFTERGLRLASGRELEAVVVVTATGLSLVPFGGFDLTVDGSSVSLPDTMAYKALMLSGVPNFVFTVGYTNASWTLKADLVAEFVSRLLTFMRERGYRSVVPLRDPSMPIEPFMDFTSGYVVRALDLLPKQGSREPWRLRQSYLRDLRTIRRGPLEDGVLEFS
jgi:cation diffusion facilitator CzcD-associated flavoprotein CzcO